MSRARKISVIRKIMPAMAIVSALVPVVVQAQQSKAAPRAVSRPIDTDTQSFQGARDAGSNGAGGDIPSSGITLYQRMGTALPDLPPEKPFKGKIDEAYGAYQRGLYVTALSIALPKAEKGDAASQTLVAEMTLRGQGIKQDINSAAFWFGRAAEGGDPAAMFQYALMLISGRGVKHDKAKADEYMRKAAEAGNSSAQFNWGQILISQNPGEKGLKLALPFYEKAAVQGLADAQYAVSQLYVAIKDLPPEKTRRAREFLERAAKAGFDTAQLDMGIWLVNGVGGERDFDEGFTWLRVAAVRGNVVAQNKLAHLYINALGTRPDPVEAAKWYVLSRRAGLPDPVLEDFYLGINEEIQKKAVEAANRFRRS
ncbi:tetratricopeptide repeat protein [Neorhizobium sp. NPDC001467]|uniref:tetratricopeptide repeat protein n=1 Tax=Neorhizobium sp. NPDC001467 TaxID=3390595 RepID=UPI003D042586